MPFFSAYDEAGNQTAQIDALDRITRYETDALGRRIKRILPKDAAEPTALGALAPQKTAALAAALVRVSLDDDVRAQLVA